MRLGILCLPWSYLYTLAKANDNCNAEKVAARFKFKVRWPWKASISTYSKDGHSKRVLFSSQNVKRDSVILDQATIVSLLKRCATMKDSQAGCSLHARIAAQGLPEANVRIGTALVDMYAKFGMLAKAQVVFDNLQERDAVSWNALIAGYMQHDHGKEALDCYEQMKLQGFFPDAATFACSLKACGILKVAEKGEEIHIEVRKSGILKESEIVGNALLDMYAKCGLLVNAQQVFDTLPQRNLVSWNTLIAGYVQNECNEEALNYYRQMQLGNVSPDDVTFTCILKACGSIRAVEKGQEIHSDIEKQWLFGINYLVGNALVDMYSKCGMLAKAQQMFDGLRIQDIVSWNALIAGYVHHDHAEEALKCFDELLQLRGLSPSAVTFSCCLKACGMIGATKRGREIHACVERLGLIRRNQVIANALVDVYAKCGVLKKAQEVFDVLPVWNIISWNALLTGYAQVGDIYNVSNVFNRMRGEGFEPNPVTFLVVLHACSHAGLVEKGQTYLDALRQTYGTIPIQKHQICIVDLLSRAGQLDSAITMMKQSPFHPDSVVWSTVLGACLKWGNKDLGDQAFKQALLVDEKEAANYVCMYNIYAAADT